MKTRFAPSPTGYLHIGNARTALFNFLLASSQSGCFVLRIEDSDSVRSSQILAEQLQLDLLWLGLPWGEGPGQVAGENGPYLQSQRYAIYAHYYQRLQSTGYVYPCFCTDKILHRERMRSLSRGEPPRYSGLCRQLSEAQIAEKRAQGQQASLRFRVPPAQRITFDDLVKGEQVFSSDDVGDFVIRRSDDSPAFFFCNAIDDALMGITHVLRGEDHLSNTPRQIMLLQALGLVIPAYGHMSLMVGAGGAPLSKREGSFSLQSLRELGYFPEALQNYLARLGHTYTRSDFMDVQALSSGFSLERVGKSPAHYDAAQLLYWQKQALAHCSDERLIAWMGEFSRELIPESLLPEFLLLVRQNSCFPGEVLQWARILFGDGPLVLAPEAKQLLKGVQARFWESALHLLEQSADFETFIKTLGAEYQLRGRALFFPLRMAWTGRPDGPTLERLYILLGRTRMRERMLHAQNL